MLGLGLLGEFACALTRPPQPDAGRRPAADTAEDHPESAVSRTDLRSSRTPVQSVVRDRPVAWATRVRPPRGKARASLAAHWRRLRSVMTGRSNSNFYRIVAMIVEASMGTPRAILHKRGQYVQLIADQRLRRRLHGFYA